MFKQAAYIKSLENIIDRPDDKPQVLFLGRSNVGKSSFINSLTNRKNLARTSNTPGKTLLMNFYLIDESFYIVDAPGYGYARRSKSMQQKFVHMIDDFLHQSEQLKLVCLLIDFKVGPTADDIDMYLYLHNLGMEVLIIATKLDKIPSTRRGKQNKIILEKLNHPQNFIKVSNTKRINIELVERYILDKVRD
jgi:GTP-binding protein